MGRKAKCKCCGKQIEIKEAYCNKKLSLDGKKMKNEYYCNELEYYQKLEEKIKENGAWDSLYKFVKFDILHYDKTQTSNSWISAIKDLRNGTTIGIGGRKVQNKSGYPYEVIENTFKEKKDAIEYAFRTKSFKSESLKIKYMMAIIKNSIDDIYFRWKKNKEFEEGQYKVDENLLYSNLQYNPAKVESQPIKLPTPKINPNGKKDLFGFLDDDI